MYYYTPPSFPTPIQTPPNAVHEAQFASGIFEGVLNVTARPPGTPAPRPSRARFQWPKQVISSQVSETGINTHLLSPNSLQTPNIGGIHKKTPGSMLKVAKSDQYDKRQEN
jgi:hypothetical protein